MRPRPDFGEKTYKGHGRLQGKVALVTGGDSGIGRAVAYAFACEGADVAIAYWNEHEDARETERIVRSAGRKVVSIAGDLFEEAHCREVVRRTVEELGRLDVLVNNAAYQGKTAKFEELTSERIERTLRTNVLAMFNLTRLGLPHMVEGGGIINTSSIQAYQPSAEILDYAVTKAAIVNFTKGLAQEPLSGASG